MFLLSASLLRADVLFSTTIWNDSIGDKTSNVFLRISYHMAGHPIFETVFPLFEDAAWGTNDLGTTRFVTAATDPDFDGFVSLMTNGIRDDLLFTVSLYGGWVGNGWSETAVIFGSTDPRIDLQGNRIDSLSIYLDSTNSYVFTAYGEAIPEPSSVSLVLLAAFLILSNVRSRRLS
jgi:hypothetical protein